MFTFTAKFIEQQPTMSSWAAYYIWREWMRYSFCSYLSAQKALELRSKALALCKMQLELNISYHWLSHAMLTTILVYQSHRELGQDERADDTLAESFSFICKLPSTPDYQVISTSAGKLLVPSHHTHFLRRYLHSFNCLKADTQHWNSEKAGFACVSHYSAQPECCFYHPAKHTATVLDFRQRKR